MIRLSHLETLYVGVLLPVNGEREFYGTFAIGSSGALGMYPLYEVGMDPLYEGCVNLGREIGHFLEKKGGIDNIIFHFPNDFLEKQIEIDSLPCDVFELDSIEIFDVENGIKKELYLEPHEK